MHVPRRVLSVENANLPKDVPIVGLGCSSFSTFFWSKDEESSIGGSWTPETIDRTHPKVQEWIGTIHYAVEECGITLLDTAPWYGHGTSEVVVGWAMEELLPRFKRERLTITTKVGRYEADPTKQFDFGYDATLHSVERSLKRMKCDYIDVLQLHDPEFAPSLHILLNETIPAMMECRKRGWCKALGLTGYPLEVQHQILEGTQQKVGSSVVVFDQCLTYSHYNLYDTSLLTRPVSDEDPSFGDYCQRNSLALMAAAPLSMGLLTHAGPPEWHPANQALQDACRGAATLCQTHGVNISTLAIVFALSNPRISSTLLGMKNIEQVKIAAEAANRFQQVDVNSKDGSPETILREILTEDEYKVWKALANPKEGPFSSVWANDEFRWDGVKEAHSFWAGVPGVEAEHWQRPLR